jgi:hypothetical protein
LSILETTHTWLKTLIKITLFSPFVVKTPKRKKGCEAKMQSRLLIILHLLIVVSLLLIIVVIINTSRANVVGSQLSRSMRGVGVEDGWEDRYVGKPQEWLFPLAVNDLLIVPHNLKALIQHIHVLIHAPACGKDTLEHLQDAGVGTRRGGGTTTMGSAGRSGSSSGGTSTRSPWILGHCGAKWVMTHILVELLLRHSLNHLLNVWSKTTRSKWVGGYVPYFIHNILKHIKAHWLHESMQQVPHICRYSLRISNSRR